MVQNIRYIFAEHEEETLIARQVSDFIFRVGRPLLADTVDFPSLQLVEKHAYDSQTVQYRGYV